MSEAKTTHKKNGIRIVQAPRQILTNTKKVTPYAPEEQAYPSKNNDEVIYNNVPSVMTPQKSLPTNTTTTTTLNDFNDESRVIRASSALISKSPSPAENDMISTKPKQEQLPSSPSGCLSNLTAKQKLVLILILVALVIVVVAAAAVLPPVYLFVIRQIDSQTSFTNITVSACSATTCIGKETPYRTSMVTVLYPFDASYGDLSGYATGTPFGTPSVPFTTASYVGIQALSPSAASFQYVQIPYLNLGQQSFTLQVWILPSGVAIPSDFGIFGQCDSNSICLSLSVRNARIALSFDSMNNNNSTLMGTTVFSNIWFHVTIVYDAVLSQQQIYVNGKIDAVSRGIVSAFQGTSSGSITTIGRSLSLAYGTSYFNGRIDHFTFSAGVARTACQIYNDATLAAYYPFDTIGTFNDYSVNLFNAIAISTTTVSKGRVGQALYFPLNTSYFQAPCYPTTRTTNPAFSIALWVNPASTTGGGSLVHMSSSQNGSGSICYDLLAFTSVGALVVQWQVNPTTVGGAQGPVIPANTWTHVAVVYSLANGVRLFINGQSSVTSLNLGTLSIQDPAAPMYVTLATNNPLGLSSASACPSGPIVISAGSYTGAVDQLRLYNRDLDTEELCVLANI